MEPTVNWQAATFFVSLGGFICLIATVFVKFGALRQMLEQHSETLDQHQAKMAIQDALLIKVIGDLQRVIGRVDSGGSRTPSARHG